MLHNRKLFDSFYWNHSQLFLLIYWPTYNTILFQPIGLKFPLTHTSLNTINIPKYCHTKADQITDHTKHVPLRNPYKPLRAYGSPFLYITLESEQSGA